MPRERNSIAGGLYNSFYCNGIFLNWWSEVRWSIRFLIKFWIPPSVSHFCTRYCTRYLSFYTRYCTTRLCLLVDMCPAGWKTFLIWENSHATAFGTHSVFFLPTVFSLNSLKSQEVFWNLTLKYIFSPNAPNSVTIQSYAHTIVIRICKVFQTHHNLMTRSMLLSILSSGNALPAISTSWTLIHPSSEVKVKSLSRVCLFATPWTVAHQAPLSIGFSRQENWSGLPFPSPGDLPDPGLEPGSPTLQADALLSEPPGKPIHPSKLSSNITSSGIPSKTLAPSLILGTVNYFLFCPPMVPCQSSVTVIHAVF